MDGWMDEWMGECLKFFASTWLLFETQPLLQFL